MEAVQTAHRQIQSPWWRLNGIPLLTGLITASAVLLLVFQLDHSAKAAFREQTRGAVVRDLAAVRGAVEIAVNRRVHSLIGLRAHVSINPSVTDEQFADLSRIIMNEVDGIRSVTSIRDNVINDVYPRKGNEGAIGLDLLAHPKQREAALHAIRTRKSWLAGPITLVQGGEAFIYRSPVYRLVRSDSPPSEQDYWGMVSLLIDKQTLVSEIMASVPDELTVAIRGRRSDGRADEFFVGDHSVLSDDAVQTSITLPSTSWELFGMPSDGWPETTPHAMQRRVAGGSMAMILGILMFWVTGAAARDRQSAFQLGLANDHAEQARQATERAANRKLAREADAITRYAKRLEQSQEESAQMLRDLRHAQQELRESNLALQRSNEELEQFAYVASHDLQEPLRKVAAFCQLLELEYGDKFDEEGKRYLHYVVDGADRMRNLIRDLLSFSKIQSKGEVLRKVDARVAVDDAIRSLEGSIDDRGAVVHVGTMPEVMGDVRLLTQLFQNLIGNGIKYNDSDQCVIDVNAERTDHSWLFKVTDNGIGIAPENQERVFGIFKRLHSQSAYAGTGIGLAICKRIVERIGGELGIDSELGNGCTFWFTVRAVDGQPSPQIVDAAPAALPSTCNAN